MKIRLHYPPSVNHYWRMARGVFYISFDGQTYRNHVMLEITRLRLVGEIDGKPMTGTLAVTMKAYPPDRRRRDLDNLWKCLLDALGHAGLYADDSQIKEMHGYMMRPVKCDGFIEVDITEISA